MNCTLTGFDELQKAVNMWIEKTEGKIVSEINIEKTINEENESILHRQAVDLETIANSNFVCFRYGNLTSMEELKYKITTKYNNILRDSIMSNERAALEMVKRLNSLIDSVRLEHRELIKNIRMIDEQSKDFKEEYLHASVKTSDKIKDFIKTQNFNSSSSTAVHKSFSDLAIYKIDSLKNEIVKLKSKKEKYLTIKAQLEIKIRDTAQSICLLHPQILKAVNQKPRVHLSIHNEDVYDVPPPVKKLHSGNIRILAPIKSLTRMQIGNKSRVLTL